MILHVTDFWAAPQGAPILYAASTVPEEKRKARIALDLLESEYPALSASCAAGGTAPATLFSNLWNWSKDCSPVPAPRFNLVRPLRRPEAAAARVMPECVILSAVLSQEPL